MGWARQLNSRKNQSGSSWKNVLSLWIFQKEDIKIQCYLPIHSTPHKTSHSFPFCPPFCPPTRMDRLYKPKGWFFSWKHPQTTKQRTEKRCKQMASNSILVSQDRNGRIALFVCVPRFQIVVKRLPRKFYRLPIWNLSGINSLLRTEYPAHVRDMPTISRSHSSAFFSVI